MQQLRQGKLKVPRWLALARISNITDTSAQITINAKTRPNPYGVSHVHTDFRFIITSTDIRAQYLNPDGDLDSQLKVYFDKNSDTFPEEPDFYNDETWDLWIRPALNVVDNMLWGSNEPKLEHRTWNVENLYDGFIWLDDGRDGPLYFESDIMPFHAVVYQNPSGWAELQQIAKAAG